MFFPKRLAALCCAILIACPLAGSAQTFTNASFETPSTGNYTYTPTGSSWTFTNVAGIQHNGSAYSGTDTVAPDGTQTAFVQGVGGSVGAMAQSVSFSTSGTYTISFKAARRYGLAQPVQVKVDSAVVGTYTPSSNAFETITTASFVVTAGSRTITFAATDNTADKTTFIDQVSIAGGGGGGSIPTAPAGLAATAGNTQVSLNWTTSSGATSYEVYRGTASNGQSATPIATGVTAPSYTDSGLTNGTAYYYKVKAVNASGASGYSNEANATPTAGGGGGGSGAFANASFETPATSSYVYNPSGATWTFTGNSGIQKNGSAFSGTAAVAPDGVQTAFLQSNGTAGAMAQSVSFSASGTYTVSFKAARRYSTIQPVQVKVDSTVVGTYTPSANTFETITTAAFTVTAGSHTVTFTATDGTGDKTTFIDQVSIAGGGGGGGSAPAAPTGLAATAGSAQVSLSWTASAGATSYEIYRGTASNGQGVTPIVTGVTTTSYTDSGLTNGTAYYYKVKAVNASGASGYSNEANATPSAGGGGGGSGTFANASFETPSTGSYVYNPSGATWTFTGNGGIQKNGSAFSGTAAVAPDGVQTAFLQSNGTAGAMSQSVSFSASGTYTIAFKAAQRYSTVQPVQVKVDSAVVGTYTPSANTFATITTAAFAVTAGNHTVTFTATDATGDKTTFIDQVSITAGGGGGGSAPVAPTGLTATAGNAQAILGWTASAGATSYEIYRGTTSNGQSVTPIATGITGTTYTNTGLTNGTAYYYKVKAVNASGTSGYSNEASATPSAGGGSAPAVPSWMNASAGNSQNRLNWAAVPGATSYNVYRGTTSNGQSATPIATGITVTNYTNTGLTNGTTYFYKVKAVNVSGTSVYTNEANATPSAGSGNGDIDLTGYTLTFADEFDNLSVTTSNPKGASRWYYLPPYGSAGFYSASTWDAAAFSITNGILSDKAWIGTLPGTWGTYWYSGNLSSVDETGAGFSQLFGYFEARVKMPDSGTGAWPAFWLVSTNGIPAVSPTKVKVSEIDIFEWYGVCNTAGAFQPYVQQASHNWNPDGSQNETTAPYLYSPQTTMPGGVYPWQGYHVYGCKVDPVHITWYIDGVQTNQIATPTDYLTSPFYIMIDYALGGGWPLGGMVNNSEMLVDWVRVYSLPGQ